MLDTSAQQTFTRACKRMRRGMTALAWDLAGSYGSRDPCQPTADLVGIRGAAALQAYLRCR